MAKNRPPLLALAQADWYEALSTVLAHLDEADSTQKLLACLGTILDPADTGILYYPHNAGPVVIDELNYKNFTNTSASLNTYRDGLYLLDPFYLYFKDPSIEDGFYIQSQIAPDDFHKTEYYQRWYVQRGLNDEVNYMIKREDGSSIAIYIGSSERFSSSDLQNLKLIKPLILAFLKRIAANHSLFDKAQTKPDLFCQLQMTFKSFGSDILTARQHEIICLILQGHSLKSTASELGISTETVKTHRHNAYEVLEIGSQAELFALFFEKITAVNTE